MNTLVTVRLSSDAAWVNCSNPLSQAHAAGRAGSMEMRWLVVVYLRKLRAACGWQEKIGWVR